MGEKLTAGRRAKTNCPRPSQLDSRIPEPHQIDYDWRFNAPTATYLARAAAPFGRVLCVGTPTVYDALVESGHDACLIDRNPYLASAFPASRAGILTLEIGDLSPAIWGREFEAAVLDPPWYACDYSLWLSRVLPLVKPRGRIVLVLFPDLVRPTARKELGWLTQRLASLGRVERMPRHAIYTTPRFEAEVLGRLGVPDLREWRTAQILRVSLGEERSVWPVPGAARIRNCHVWQRFAYGRQIVAVRVDPIDTGQVRYHAAGGSFELRSTSRRDRQASMINLWTSRNRGAVACGTAKIVAFLARLEAGQPPQAACAALGASDEDAAALIHLTESLQVGAVGV